MSTRKIRRALGRLNFAEAGVKEQYDAAMDAVREIEQLARTILDDSEVRLSPDTLRTLLSIKDGAP